MIDLDQEVRAALREIADAGTPVNLGTAALVGVRRHRRRRIASSVAAAALVLLAVLAPTVARRPAPIEPVAPHSAPGEEHVISAYADANDKWWLLDPASGDYLPVGGPPGPVSPDLAWAAGVGGGEPDYLYSYGGIELQLSATDPNGVDRGVVLPALAWQPTWSADSTWVALPVIDKDSRAFGTFHEVLLVDIITSTVHRRTLDLGDRAGVTLAFGQGTDLIVGTTPTVGTDGQLDEIATFRSDGSLVGRTSVPTGAPCSADMSVGFPPLVRDGALLLCLRTTDGLRFLRVGPAAPGPGPVPVAEAGAIGVYPGKAVAPAAWTGPDTVALVTGERPPGAGIATSGALQLADLRTGTIGPAVTKVPTAFRAIRVSPADALPAGSRALIF